ncbi:MAG: GxxExxY protein [Proteobacteria bacterium]|nr:GxxExxY protein [Pseudomonadota bacterium]
MTENEIGTLVIESAIKVHKRLGPGLLELIYEVALCHELKQHRLTVKRQVPIPITYEGILFDEGFKADIIINDKVLLELKSVENLHPVHKKQLLTYLKLANINLGYLLNFNESLMKEGITRIVNNLKE